MSAKPGEVYQTENGDEIFVVAPWNFLKAWSLAAKEARDTSDGWASKVGVTYAGQRDVVIHPNDEECGWPEGCSDETEVDGYAPKHPKVRCYVFEPVEA